MGYQQRLSDNAELRVYNNELILVKTDNLMGPDAETAIDLTIEEAGELRDVLNRVIVDTISYKVKFP